MKILLGEDELEDPVLLVKRFKADGMTKDQAKAQGRRDREHGRVNLEDPHHY